MKIIPCRNRGLKQCKVYLFFSFSFMSVISVIVFPISPFISRYFYGNILKFLHSCLSILQNGNFIILIGTINNNNNKYIFTILASIAKHLVTFGMSPISKRSLTGSNKNSLKCQKSFKELQLKRLSS